MKTNKFLTSSLITFAFSLALAMQAQASSSYCELYTAAYAKDTSPSTEKRADYTAYYCTKAAAKVMFGDAATLKAIEDYLKANFADGKSAMEETTAAEGNYALTQGDYDLGQYSFVSHFAEQIAAGNYFAVAFYGDDAFRVFESADVDSGNLRFDDKNAATAAGDWQTVPEPTSGLLFLLGLAGLCLRRKQK